MDRETPRKMHGNLLMDRETPRKMHGVKTKNHGNHLLMARQTIRLICDANWTTDLRNQLGIYQIYQIW